MEEQFYTILTNIGKAKIANSNVLGTKLNLTKFIVGDSSGSYYNPTEEQTELKNKVWEGSINSINIDKSNPNWIVIETVIPSDIGGFTIREAGILDNENNLIAVAKYPETYKPLLKNGSSKDIILRVILEISNASNVTLKVDPSVTIATKQDILDINKKLARKYIDETKKTFYVDENIGSDENDGLSKDKPVKTLQGAFNKLSLFVKIPQTIELLSDITIIEYTTIGFVCNGYNALTIKGNNYKIKSNEKNYTIDFESIGRLNLEKINFEKINIRLINVTIGEVSNCNFVEYDDAMIILGSLIFAHDNYFDKAKIGYYRVVNLFFNSKLVFTNNQGGEADVGVSIDQTSTLIDRGGNLPKAKTKVVKDKGGNYIAITN